MMPLMLHLIRQIMPRLPEQGYSANVSGVGGISLPPSFPYKQFSLKVSAELESDLIDISEFFGLFGPPRSIDLFDIQLSVYTQIEPTINTLQAPSLNQFYAKDLVICHSSSYLREMTTNSADGPDSKTNRRSTYPLIAAFAILVAFAVSFTFLPNTASARNDNKTKSLIPLYDGGIPSDWFQVCSQASGAGEGSLVIADVNVGPGKKPIGNWANVIKHCYDYSKASVIGYVWTNYGRDGVESIPKIEATIDKWYQFYPDYIAGIFLDGVSDEVPETLKSNSAFYKELTNYEHTRHPESKVVLNFGYNPASDWMFYSSNSNNADVIVTFEGSYNTEDVNPYVNWKQVDWEKRYPANNFALIIYDAPNTAKTPQPGSSCKRLAKQNIGYVYVGMRYDAVPYLGDAC
jgi:hypothetical protein